MPTTSKPQERLMLAIAHGWKMPGGKGPSVKVAQDFVRADEEEGKVTPRHGLMPTTGKPRVERPEYASGSRGPRKSLGGHLHLKRHRKGVR